MNPPKHIPELTTAARAKAIDWACGHGTGASSEAMCNAIFGTSTRPDKRRDHPLDGSDFGRCVALLEAVPEARDYLPTVAGLSDVWLDLVSNWDQLEKLFKEHKADDFYKLLNSIIR